MIGLVQWAVVGAVLATVLPLGIDAVMDGPRALKLREPETQREMRVMAFIGVIFGVVLFVTFHVVDIVVHVIL